jgi:hypothetical protein
MYELMASSIMISSERGSAFDVIAQPFRTRRLAFAWPYRCTSRSRSPRVDTGALSGSRTTCSYRLAGALNYLHLIKFNEFHSQTPRFVLTRRIHILFVFDPKMRRADQTLRTIEFWVTVTRSWP